MDCDYQKIREENRKKYGTRITKLGDMLFTKLYADQTHFIYELLQNAEDALARRDPEFKNRSVQFELSSDKLKFSHFGDPFDEDDVRGICGVIESTKDITEIGRFGIGFKSVYAFTGQPEVHSGPEHFAIEKYVSPVEVPAVPADDDETIIVMPLKNPVDDFKEIHVGLQDIKPTALLFLREIEKIEWSAGNRSRGQYRRKIEKLDEHVQRVTITGKMTGQRQTYEAWLVFLKPMHMNDASGDKKFVGHVEVAFKLDQNTNRVIPISHSPLFAFFPTELETNLGFLIQGPYCTTPNRGRIPKPSRGTITKEDHWNRNCVNKTAEVLSYALTWLRKNQLLDVNVLRCLPLEQEKFEDHSNFVTLYKKVKKDLSSRPLLPSSSGGYVAGVRSKLARSQGVRKLFRPKQLTKLLGNHSKLEWLSGDISQDRTPELRQYLMWELNINEITLETILRNIDKTFMNAQTNSWVRRFYEFLKDQPGQLELAKKAPLIRLTDGKHVEAYSADGKPQAFLPGEIETDSPTVCPAVCDSEDSRGFLNALGLTKPNPVDDVILKILPKYENAHNVGDDEYDTDIRHIINAFINASMHLRDKLIKKLCETSFVSAVNAGDGSRCYARPKELYIATDRMEKLFTGITGIKLVNNACATLRGEDASKLLKACGAHGDLQIISKRNRSIDPQSAKFAKLRLQAGYPHTSSRKDVVEERMICGLEDLLAVLHRLSVKERQNKAKLLWEELVRLAKYNDNSFFDDIYAWSYYGDHSKRFEATFVRQLNEGKWVPDEQGELHRPEQVLFESLNWTSDPFLESKIHFKTPASVPVTEDQCMVEVLKENGINTTEELRSALKEAGRIEDSGAIRDNTENGPNGAGKYEQRKRDFITYIGVTVNDKNPVSDGSNEANMDLEENAIKFIREKEPKWKRTKRNNPGFDLYQEGSDRKRIRWCEVKAMTGSFNNRPVGLSRTQFEYAQKHGKKYWLYIVEHAENEKANILRIQDPAGKARTFTFDHGWREIAQEVD